MLNNYFINENDLLEVKNEVLDFFKNAIDYSNGNYNEEYFENNENLNVIDDDVDYYQLSDYCRMIDNIKRFKIGAKYYNRKVTDDDIKAICDRYNKC